MTLLPDHFAAVFFLAGLILGLAVGRTKRRVAIARAVDAEEALAESLRVNVELAQKFNAMREAAK